VSAMRCIGNLASENAAARFSDFLLIRGIENQFDAEDDGTFSLWVHDEGEIAQATELLAKYRATPNAPEFDATTQATKQRREQLQSEDARRSTVADSARLGYERHFQGTPYFTYLLIVISVAVAVYSELGENRQAIQFLNITEMRIAPGFVLNTKHLPEVSAGQIWRLVTPIFIHFHLLHIAFNMLLLKDLGSLFERRFSMAYFAAFVLISAALSNYAQFLIGGPGFGGMSGVDYALFGFLWMRGKFDRFADWSLDANTVYAMIGWFFLCVIGIIPDVANMCHAAGLAAGMTWGWLSSKRLFSR
jgi:GlpG protein